MSAIRCKHPLSSLIRKVSFVIFVEVNSIFVLHLNQKVFFVDALGSTNVIYETRYEIAQLQPTTPESNFDIVTRCCVAST